MEKVNKSTKASIVANTSSLNNKDKTTSDQKKGAPRANGALIRKKTDLRPHHLSWPLKYEIVMCTIVL